MKKMWIVVLALCASTAMAAPPAYQCWNGAIVKNPKHCPPVKLPVVCPDGKVVSDVKLCYIDPIICPDTGCEPLPQPVSE